MLRANTTRPWDYDTEDSGVDSVSSLAGLEAESGQNNLIGSGVEYSAVIVNNNKVNAQPPQLQQRKSFLHTVYGGVQLSSSRPPPSAGSVDLDCNANQNSARKNVNKNISNKRQNKSVYTDDGQQHHRMVESAKNNFLHSLLDDESHKAVSNSRSTGLIDSTSTPTESTGSSTSTMALDLLPELVQLLDANGVMDGGLIELIGRDGTRASLRVTLAHPPNKPTASSATNAVSTGSTTSCRRNSFNSRLHRNSKRSSQRRSAQSSGAATATTTATALSTVSSSAPLLLASSSVPVPSLAVSSGGLTTAQRPRSVRRRPSSSSSIHKKVPAGFSVSMAIPPSKVAILASKFNSLINESRRTGNASATATAAPAATTTATNATPIRTSSGDKTSLSAHSTWSWRLVPSVGTASQSVKRHTPTSSNSSTVRRPIDTIPEIIDQTEDCADYSKPRRKSYDLSQASGKIHPPARPLPSDPATSSRHNHHHHHQQGQQSVYGTVMSIVKQAIRKFEKLEDGTTLATVNPSGNATTSTATNTNDSAISNDPDSPVILPEGIAPNSSFLWRDHKSMQNLIYEATSFNERAAAAASTTMTTNSCRIQHEANHYYEMGSSRYDTLRSRRSNAYDSLHHSHHNKSSSSSSSGGYDEIRSPGSISSFHRPGTDPSIRYDDVKAPVHSLSSVTYDELSYRIGRRQSNGYDELRSPPSASYSSAYIDPGSSSALGYERILSPTHHQDPVDSVEPTEDEDGSTLRYEECGSPSALPNGPVTVTALPAIVCEDQFDSISYLYDDIRAVNVNRNGNYGGACYSGSNHSYEPIYAHLGDASSQMDSTFATDSHHQSNETLSGGSFFSSPE